MSMAEDVKVLAAIERPTKRRKINMSWKKLCRKYKELREIGLIQKDGRAYVLTERGKEVLKVFGD
jgi:predicted transcriptional regulator